MAAFQAWTLAALGRHGQELSWLLVVLGGKEEQKVFKEELAGKYPRALPLSVRQL